MRGGDRLSVWLHNSSCVGSQVGVCAAPQGLCVGGGVCVSSSAGVGFWGFAMGATVVDYMPMLLVLHGHQQLHTAIQNRFYLHFRGANRLVQIEDLDCEFIYFAMADRHEGVAWLSWGNSMDARRAASEILASHRVAGIGAPALDLLEIGLRHRSDTGYLRDLPVRVERLW